MLLQSIEQSRERDRLHVESVGKLRLMHTLLARDAAQHRRLRPVERQLQGERPLDKPAAQQPCRLLNQMAERTADTLIELRCAGIGRIVGRKAGEGSPRRYSPGLRDTAASGIGAWGRGAFRPAAAARQAMAQPVEIEIDDGCGVERQHLADQQTADDGDTQRPPQLRALALADRQRQAAEKVPRKSSS